MASAVAEALEPFPVFDVTQVRVYQAVHRRYEFLQDVPLASELESS